MTLLRWREHPAARDEARDAAIWYESESVGLGDRFADAIEAGTTFIRTWPHAAPARHGGDSRLRSKPVDVFPYAIVYTVRADEVIVIAYAHEHRRPGYWRERLAEL